VLRSKTVANIEKEFAAHVLAYQLVRLLMAQVYSSGLCGNLIGGKAARG
jgi:hypothetical protein